jgi:hypothetical protein
VEETVAGRGRGCERECKNDRWKWDYSFFGVPFMLDDLALCVLPIVNRRGEVPVDVIQCRHFELLSQARSMVGIAMAAAGTGKLS